MLNYHVVFINICFSSISDIDLPDLDPNCLARCINIFWKVKNLKPNHSISNSLILG